MGDIVPNHAAAGAKAIIAYHDPETIDTFFDKEMPRFTHKTIMGSKVIKRELKKARREGVAFCREEMEIGLNAIGVPISNHDKRPIAPVVVPGLTHRVKCNVNSPMVAASKKAASNISAKLFLLDP